MSMAYTIKRYVGFVSLVLVFVFILSTEARADMYLYGFEVVENNSNTAVADQLSLKVTDPGTTYVSEGIEYNQVRFTFYNDGPSPSIYDVPDPCQSSITDVYFEDGTLLKRVTIENSPPEVIFGIPVSPKNLTGAGTLDPPFVATTIFSVDSNPPVQPNGVNPGESLGLLYALKYDEFGNPFTFDDVIAAIELGFTNPDAEEPRDSLRIGIRVQGVGQESDSFILTPTPGSLLLGSIGIGMVIARCRKRKTLIES